MITKAQINFLSDLFVQRVNEKNSWGKNELITLWQETLLEALLAEEEDLNN